MLEIQKKLGENFKQKIKALLNDKWFKIIYTYALFGEGNGTPLQYSCLENPMDGGSW